MTVCRIGQECSEMQLEGLKCTDKLIIPTKLNYVAQDWNGIKLPLQDIVASYVRHSLTTW